MLLSQLKAIKNQRGRAEQHPYDQIPCNETSDAEKLCREPVVSVMVLAFNHEKYIRECLDSLVAQIADFPYEIVIGEDCSTDRTREICFEYQKRFPDKIRVLWSEENLYSYNGNELRTRYKCRGEYVTYCEGDDYYTDPRKLQKQVDLIRRADAVMCVAFTDWVYSDHTVRSTYGGGTKGPDGILYLTVEDFKRHYFHTTTYLMRRDAFLSLDTRFPRMVSLNDTQVEFCLATLGKVVLLPEVVTVYRWSGEGVASRLNKIGESHFHLRMFTELYFHGPESQRAYFARAMLDSVDWVFMVNRRYRPTPLTAAEFVEVLKVRRWVLRNIKNDLRPSIKYYCEYCLSVGLYLIKRLLGWA